MPRRTTIVALAYDEKGEYDRAIADYTEAIRIKPDYAEAYRNRGVAYAEKGEYDRAIADYTEAIRLKPDYAEAYYNRGIAYARKASTTKPSPTTRKPSGSSRTMPRRTPIVALAYGAKGEYDRAIADCTEAIRLKPDLCRGVLQSWHRLR